MNLVGKILVVLIFVMSLVFMSLALMTYATHKNWRDVVLHPTEGLKFQLENLRSQLTDVEAQRKKVQVDLENERAANARAVSKLTTELGLEKQEREKLQADEARQVEELRQAVVAMNAMQATLAKLRDEVTNLRTAGENARKERDKALADSVLLEDQLAQQKGELNRLQKRETQLQTQVAVLDLAIQDAGIQIDRIPPRVDGIITDSRENGLVELSIGKDDGLEVGNELDVFRLGGDANSSKYLGRVRVVRIEADRSVAQVVPELRQGPIQKDDRVTTKLR
jgi:hypothetical protein